MSELHQVEMIVNLLLQSIGSWGLSSFVILMQFFSFLGTEEFFLIVFPFLFWCIDPGMGFRTGLLLLFSTGINTPLKLIFHQPRPYWIDTRVRAFASESSFGLPSGHSQNAVAIWGFFSLATPRSWLKILLYLTIFLIGLSRIFLGVHFLSDVLVGWLLGALILIAFLRLEKDVTAWVKAATFFKLELVALLGCILLALLTVLPGLALAGWQIPAEWVANARAANPSAVFDPLNIESGFTIGGIWLGLVAGYAWLQRKAGGFPIQATLAQKTLRYLLGMAGVLVLYLGLKLVFPAGQDLLSYLLRGLRYALVGGWVAAAAPLLFKKLRLYR